MITHPDFDHYGGFHELPAKIQEIDPFERITVGTVYHDGIGRFSKPYTEFIGGTGMSQLGPVVGSTLPEAYLTTLIDDFSDIRKYSKSTSSRNYKLSGDYADWLKSLEALEGKGIEKMQRVHYAQNYLPGYTPSDNIQIRILGPVEETWNGKPALRYIDTASKSAMGKPSKTRNGLSVVLRLQYQDARILLTGDLNFKSQSVLMKHIPNHEFKAHVVKMCHHGAEDVSWKFLQATDPVAVMASSGDNESHTHPRAKILGWSGAFATPIQKGRDKKYLNLKEANYRSPLLYSTELSRSVQLWDTYKAYDRNAQGQLNEIADVQLQPRGRKLKKPDSETPKPMKKWMLANRLVYGLINVRTDGQKILMAVMKEKGKGFQVESFNAY